MNTGIGQPAAPVDTEAIKDALTKNSVVVLPPGWSVEYLGMTFNDYQAASTETALYPGQGSLAGLLYVGLGLGEAGEVQGKIKKILRDSDGIVTDEARAKIKAELGDVLWYVSQCCTELELSLNEVAAENLEKLFSRRDRGVLKGSGDDR